MDWIHLQWEPVAGSCKNGNEPLGSITEKKVGNFLISCMATNFTRRILLHSVSYGYGSTEHSFGPPTDNVT